MPTLSILEIFTEKSVLPELSGSTKPEVLEEMVRGAVNAGVLPKGRRSQVLEALLEREQRGSTGLGRGIAVPHAKIEGLRQHSGFVARSSTGIDFRSIDGEPVHVLIMLVSPESRIEEHLQLLRWVSTVARDPDVPSFIRQARSAADIAEVLRERAG